MSHHALNHGVDRGKRAPVVGAPRCARRSWFGETWLFFCCSQAALGPIFWGLGPAWARPQAQNLPLKLLPLLRNFSSGPIGPIL